MAVGLLIDESGSMSSSDRITYARMTAIVLYDFCQSLQIPVTIYGHTTPDCEAGVALYSYAEFDSIDTSDRYRLMDMSTRNGNRDGAALRYVAEHLSKRPENQKLLIIISDGQPADYGYSGTEAEADLRGIKKEYSKKGIILFAAAIGSDKEKQQDWQSQNQGQDQGYAQNGQYQGQAQEYSQNSQYQDQTQNYTQNGQYQNRTPYYMQNNTQNNQYQNQGQGNTYAA